MNRLHTYFWYFYFSPEVSGSEVVCNSKHNPRKTKAPRPPEVSGLFLLLNLHQRFSATTGRGFTILLTTNPKEPAGDCCHEKRRHARTDRT